jgi:hypothetical protein
MKCRRHLLFEDYYLGHSGLCKLWIFEFYTFLIWKVYDSECSEATVDFLLNHVRRQTRKLYELVCTDFFYDSVVLKFIINKNQMKCQVQIKVNDNYVSPTQCSTRCSDTFITSSICRNCIHPETWAAVMNTTVCRISGDILIVVSKVKGA